jgi:hypothetical protein
MRSRLLRATILSIICSKNVVTGFKNRKLSVEESHPKIFLSFTSVTILLNHSLRKKPLLQLLLLKMVVKKAKKLKRKKKLRKVKVKRAAAVVTKLVVKKLPCSVHQNALENLMNSMLITMRLGRIVMRLKTTTSLMIRTWHVKKFCLLLKKRKKRLSIL